LKIDTIDIAQSNSLHEVIDQSRFKVYPNPTSGITYLDIDLENPQDLLIRIFNPFGYQVFSVPYFNIKKDVLQLDLSDFASGSYSMVINSKNGYISFMVQLVR